MAGLPPIRREVIVGADPDLAFTVFADDIGRWWPLHEHSVYGAGSTVEFRDGRLVECRVDREDVSWGTVTTWTPPDELAFTWHPGRGEDVAGRVRVRFEAAGPGRTLVSLEHSGWEVYEDPEAARAEYGQGWPLVLAQFRANVHSERGTWVALLHRPAAAGAGEHVFADARFRDHVAFLARMEAAGQLVAAGPLGDEPGAGLTVLRLPGVGRWDEAERLATQDDASVTGGLFTVRVRPWRVRAAG